MIDAKRLLADLKRLRKRLEDDLRAHHAGGPQQALVRAEWQAALDSRRTADAFEAFWTAALDQAAVHWLLALVFLRFLEDNRLLDRPVLAGEGERGELAAERQRAHFRVLPHDSDAEYLLVTLAEAQLLPGLSGLFDPAHNPLFRLPVSGDMAMELFRFLRARGDGGALVHDFTDPEWNTRFLGDLYQDLSEDARKRYALLQTPDFVESWILDRTLHPAIREFGFPHVRMIDPACGSGHFLLGGFARLLALWQQAEPGTNAATLAQRAMDGVAGVDLNPFAVEIARFRLLLAALHAAGITRLAAAPDFRMTLAVGDSLLHGTHFFRGELGGAGVGLGRQVRGHAFAAEDLAEVEAILGRQYHAVVGNPPYITPKDAAMRDAYRDIYASCHRTYGLGAPFVERFFDLAQRGTPERAAGFVGLIVANSFMKREFGSKLIEQVLPALDLTHVVDCSGAYIPGHGTPTAILFGRNRAPLEGVVRTVRGIRGEPGAPDEPAQGQVWTAIVAQTDECGSVSGFISVEDTSRTALETHPWNMGGGGAADLQAAIESERKVLGTIVNAIGFGAVTREDDAYLMPPGTAIRHGIPAPYIRPMIEGENVRDYRLKIDAEAIWPYNRNTNNAEGCSQTERFLWPARSSLIGRVAYGLTQLERDLQWFEYSMFFKNRFAEPLTITFGEVATHNHFVLDRGGKVFNRTAPVIKLPAGTDEDVHLGLLGLLNSSTACFWLKKRCNNKAAPGGGSANDEPWRSSFAFNSSNVSEFPLVCDPPLDLARALDTQAQRLSVHLAAALCARATPAVASLAAARAEAEAARANMIALQEELDWRCYRLYGLLDDPPEHPQPAPLRLGERAFEIVMARQIEAGTLETAWFSRHRSTPTTDLPSHWPDDYRAVVERRIALIEADPSIGLIERPEYKRRWASAPWEEQEQDALRTWLLDRLETPRYWPREEPGILTTRGLADLARRDPEFCAVAALYAGAATLDLDSLVATLVTREAVPFLAALRYSTTGLRKRAEWEETWDKQRQEDAIDAAVEAERPAWRAQARAGMEAFWAAEGRTPETDATRQARIAAHVTDEAVEAKTDSLVAAEQKRRKEAEVGRIPVPPKYKSVDFQHVDLWRLRGGLDVPKERFVSFPGAAPDTDGTLPVLWAGHLHLPRAQALATWIMERRERDGWPAARLAPLLAGLLELVPWLRQWHNGIDEETGLRMGDYYAEFVADQARTLGLTLDDLRGWAPTAPARRGRGPGKRSAA